MSQIFLVVEESDELVKGIIRILQKRGIKDVNGTAGFIVEDNYRRVRPYDNDVVILSIHVWAENLATLERAINQTFERVFREPWEFVSREEIQRNRMKRHAGLDWYTQVTAGRSSFVNFINIHIV